MVESTTPPPTSIPMHVLLNSSRPTTEGLTSSSSDEGKKDKSDSGSEVIDQQFVDAKKDSDLEKPDPATPSKGDGYADAAAGGGGGSASRPTRYGPDGNPIITTGHDVSHYLVSLRDDGDEALTLRSWVLGILLGILNNVLAAMFTAKPTTAGFTDVFNMLILYIAGTLWAKTLPVPETLKREGKTWDKVRRVVGIINPNRSFQIKEHVVSLMVVSLGYLGGWAVDPLAVAKLFFNAHLNPATVILGLLALSTIGLGLVGVLAPAIIYPSELVYWNTVPLIHSFQALHFSLGDSADTNKRRRKVFGWCLLGAFCWEIIPSYMMPWLNGLSIPCLATMHASPERRKVVSRIFGGARANEGLGLFSLSLDPQYVPFSTYAGSPTKFLAQYFGGAILGAFVLLALYQTNTWSAKTFPFMSSQLYTESGDSWDQSIVFDSSFKLNETGLAQEGLPRMAVAEAFSIMTTAMGLGGLIVHVLLFLSREVIEDFRRVKMGTLDDPHFQAMKKYKPIPEWVWLAFMSVGVPLAFVTIYIGHTTLPWWGLIIALVFGTFMTPISLSIYGRYGSAVPTTMISKMLAGIVHPDRPVSNLYFAVFSHHIVEVSGTVAGMLKLGQYLKIPPRVNLCAMMFSILVGAYTQWIVTSKVIDGHREILLDAQGNQFWFGGYWQDLNVQAVEWSLAKRVFSVHSGLNYEWIPLGIFIGGLVPLVHWILTHYVKWLHDMKDQVAFPIGMYYMSALAGGVNSPFLSSFMLALFTQFWLRVRRPKLFIEFNYIVAAGVDGGVAIMIFILSFAVMGAMGTDHPFPHWFGNPASPESPDHCIMPEA